MGALYTVDSFVVQNTHNRWANDRGTLDFRIQISLDNSSWTTVVDNTLDWTNSSIDPIPLQTFDITSADARYVKFWVDSSYGYGGGINELEVYGSPVPLPGAVWLLGSGLVGLGLMGCRKLKKL